MKYTKVFEDTLNGVKYFVSEYCGDSNKLQHLVLCELDGTNVVEVSSAKIEATKENKQKLNIKNFFIFTSIYSILF